MVLAGFVLASLPLPFVWQTPANGWDALLLCSLGVFGGLGHYCLVRAFELAPAPFVSPFNYAQILGADGERAGAVGWARRRFSAGLSCPGVLGFSLLLP